MSYVKIGPHVVFLTHKRDRALDAAALADKEPVFRVSSRIHGTDASREAEKLRYRHLLALHATNSPVFVQDWVQFDLWGKEARENAWDLLYCYCQYSRVGSLASQQSERDALIADYAGDSYAYPMGRVFELRIHSPHTLGSLLGFRARHTLAAIEVDTQRVVCARGSLTHFILSFDHQALECGKELRILPAIT